MRLILACVALFLLSGYAHAQPFITTGPVFATPSTLAATIAKAPCGATVLLAGEHPKTVLKGRQCPPDAPLTLDMTRATFAGFGLQSSTGVTVLGGVYKAVAPNDGIAVAGSSDVVLKAPTVIAARNCLGIYSSARVTVDDANLSGCQIDGADVWYSQFVTISRLACHDFDLRDNHHPDCVQLLSSYKLGITSDVTVRDSLAYGAMQGFSGFDHGTGGYDRVRFINNTAKVTYAAGLYLVECRNCTLTGNTVETLPGAQFRASITTTRTSNLISCGNSIAAGAGKKGVLPIACKP
jgi:parallel beta-helix repeat protein